MMVFHTIRSDCELKNMLILRTEIEQIVVLLYNFNVLKNIKF